MNEPVTLVACAPRYLLTKAEAVTGLSIGAMRKKIERGQWLLDREYTKAPDGKLYLIIEGFVAWVESSSAG